MANPLEFDVSSVFLTQLASTVLCFTECDVDKSFQGKNSKQKSQLQKHKPMSSTNEVSCIKNVLWHFVNLYGKSAAGKIRIRG